MDTIVIEGGKVLKGAVRVSGSKNAVLPILCSSLLASGEHVFHNVPKVADVSLLSQILISMGCDVDWVSENSLRVRVRDVKDKKIPYELVKKMRASILFLGPVLTRYGEVTVSFPGGCAIGIRPVDYHIKGMKELGAHVNVEKGYIHATAPNLKGTKINLKEPSVGATENIMMAAALAEGETIIENAAKEPEIIDLAEYLKKMGGCVEGAGTSKIEIQGVNSLKPAEHTIIPDRIEAATLLIGGAITGGKITLTHCNPDHMKALLEKMKESGFAISVDGKNLLLERAMSWKGVNIVTQPYPEFPTDIQAQFMTLMLKAEGKSVIEETIFENRFMHVQELVRLGAKIDFEGSRCVVHGGSSLTGTRVMATDLRASSSLILAGLVAKGETEVQRVYHLDRGYENLEGKLSHLGAQVKRVKH